LTDFGDALEDIKSYCERAQRQYSLSDLDMRDLLNLLKDDFVYSTLRKDKEVEP